MNRREMRLNEVTETIKQTETRFSFPLICLYEGI